MATVLNLEEFLCAESSEASLRGTGAFEEEKELARQRFSEFRFPDEDCWIPILLQAAACWETELVQVRQQRFTTSFRFEPEPAYPLPTGTEIFRTLVHGDLSGSRPLERFCLALRVLREWAGLSFLLIVDRGDGRPLVTCNGIFFKRMSRGRRLHAYYVGLGITLVVSYVRDQETRVQHLFKPSLCSERGQSVTERLNVLSELLPYALTIDSRRKDNTFASRLWQNVGHADLLAITGWRHDGGDPGLVVPPVLRPESTGHQVFNLLTDERVQGFLLVCCGVGERWSELLLVAHGVVVERQPLFGQFPFGYRVVVDASGLPKDKTGLSLEKSDQRTELLNEIQGRVQVQLNILRSRTDQLLPLLARFFDQDSKAITYSFHKALDSATGGFSRSFASAR